MEVVTGFSYSNNRKDNKMDNTKKFKELYLAGEVAFEAIDDYSYEWGMSDEECTLAQYLGLNEEEEDAWVSDSEEALRELLNKSRKKSSCFDGGNNKDGY